MVPVWSIGVQPQLEHVYGMNQTRQSLETKFGLSLGY